MRWKKVTLVGVGLLGGSLGLALRQRKLARTVVGFVRRHASLKQCKRAGAVDSVTLDLSEAVREADLVVLCTPLAQMRRLVAEFAPVLSKGAIVTDVGSVKGSVVRELEKPVAMAGGRFVGSHPMAGSDQTGVRAARADLFNGAVCIVTPTRASEPAAVKAVEDLWRAVGARILRLSPRAHDDLVSRSSHLPHVMAAALVNLVLSSRTGRKEQQLVCANGFRDTTRVASGSPEMWRDIALANGRNISRAVAQVIKELERFDRAVQRLDERSIAKFFEAAKQSRDQWLCAGSSTSPE